MKSLHGPYACLPSCELNCRTAPREFPAQAVGLASACRCMIVAATIPVVSRAALAPVTRSRGHFRSRITRTSRPPRLRPRLPPLRILFASRSHRATFVKLSGKHICSTSINGPTQCRSARPSRATTGPVHRSKTGCVLDHLIAAGEQHCRRPRGLEIDHQLSRH
jgi:hypothetical protein